MTLAMWCVLVAALLPIACAWMAKSRGFGVPRSQGGFDNHDPRQWMTTLRGWQARANSAQANSFEALPFFIGAVVLSQQVGAPQGTIDALAVAFVACRVVYIALYVTDRAPARSVVWALGLGVNIALLTAGAWAR